MQNLVQQDLLQQGLDLAIYGMATVFFFLTVLVFATSIMSRIVLAFTPLPPTPEPFSGSDKDQRLVAVITAAVARFRDDK